MITNNFLIVTKSLLLVPGCQQGATPDDQLSEDSDQARCQQWVFEPLTRHRQNCASAPYVDLPAV